MRPGTHFLHFFWPQSAFLQDQEIGEFYVVQERRTTDFEAPKMWKGSSGPARHQETESEQLFF